MSRSRILLTGGTGFIGVEVAKAMQPYADLTFVVRSLDRTTPWAPEQCLLLSQVPHFLSGKQIDTVINLANSYSFDDSVDNTTTLLSANIVFPSMLAAMIKNSGQSVHWIQASTFMQHFNSRDYEPSCLYAATKQAFEDILRFYEYAGFRVTTLVLPQVFGESDSRGKILNVLLASVSSRRLVNLSSGRQILDLVHVEDVTRALRLVVSERIQGRWQLSSGRPLSIRQIVEIIEQCSGCSLSVSYEANKDRVRDVYDLWHCAPPLPGWSPSIQVETWIQSQLNELA